MDESKFTFPDDMSKTPLLTVSATLTEKDYSQLAYNKSTGARAVQVINIVICGAVMFWITVLAVLSHAYISAAIYGAVTVGVLLLPFFQRYLSKKSFHTVPNDSKLCSYAFYRHHVDFTNDYCGLYLDYDIFSSATENALGFSLSAIDGGIYCIPKSALSKEDSVMLKNILINKLGSKFHSSVF